MTLDSKAALRSARNQRLASKPAVSAAQSQTVVSQEVSVQKSAASVAEKLVAAVLDPKAVSKAAELHLQLFNERSSDPHWLVCADGQPVAQIRLSDQDDVGSVSKVFTTDGYANGIASAASRMDLDEVLTSVRARPYVSAVESSTAYSAIEAKVKAEGLAEIRKAKANLRNDMINTLNLVVTANSKNFITENPLKGALFSRMTSAGIENDRAVAIIEAAFQEKSSEYFEALFKKAMQWGELSPEAYREIEEQINDLPQRTPTVEVDDLTITASKNVNLMTYTAAADFEVADEKQQLKGVLGLRARNNSRVINR
jgi:hypothetical protein